METISIVICALLFLSPAVDQTPISPTQAGVVGVRYLPDLAPDLVAMPRVLVGTGVTQAVAMIINRHLADLDAAVLKEVADCRRSTRLFHQSSDHSREVNAAHDF